MKYPRLIKSMQGKSSLVIVMQDNPDPDSIAAAVALRKLANATAGLKCSIAHGGTVGRGENRTLVKYLNLNLLDCRKIERTFQIYPRPWLEGLLNVLDTLLGENPSRS